MGWAKEHFDSVGPHPHNLVFSVEDIMIRQNNKTGIKTTLIFLGFKILK